jgi:hypothetical protein
MDKTPSKLAAKEPHMKRSPITYVGPTLRERIVDAVWFVVGLASIVGAVVWAIGGK